MLMKQKILLRKKGVPILKSCLTQTKYLLMVCLVLAGCGSSARSSTASVISAAQHRARKSVEEAVAQLSMEMVSCYKFPPKPTLTQQIVSAVGDCVRSDRLSAASSLQQSSSPQNASESESSNAQQPRTARKHSDRFQESSSSSRLAGPQSIQISLPQKVQETNWHCAPACLQMILESHGVYRTQYDLGVLMNTQEEVGTEPEDVARVASNLLYDAPVATGPDDPGYQVTRLTPYGATEEDKALFCERVIRDIQAGAPVFVQIDVANTYGPSYAHVVHEGLIYGIELDENGTLTQLHFIDPSYDQQDGQNEGRKVFTVDELWTGMINNQEPAYIW